MPPLNLPQPIGKKIKAERTKGSKGPDGRALFKWPHPLRKPPRLEGKVQNRGLRKLAKPKRSR